MGHLYHVTAADLARLDIDVWPGPGLDLLTTVYVPVTLFLAQPWAPALVMLAWLYPFAALLRRPMAALKPPPGPPLGPPLGLRLALLVGVAGGAGFTVLAVAARAAVHRASPDAAGASYLYFAGIGLAVLVQAAVAGVVTGVLAAGERPFGVLIGQFAAWVTGVLATAAMLGVQTLGGCLPALRFAPATCGRGFDRRYAMNLLGDTVVQGALAALVVGVLVRALTVLVARLPAGMRPDRAAVQALAVGGGVVVLLLAGSAAAATTYGTAAAPVAAGRTPSSPDPSPAGPPVTGPRVGPGRALAGDAEAERIARTVGAGLPDYWTDNPPAPATNTFEPRTCEPLARATYAAPIEPDRVATAAVELDNGGTLASALLSATVDSYRSPVPASVIDRAAADVAACPGFRATTSSGFAVDFRVGRGTAPSLGDQSLRYDYALSAGTTTGTQAVFIVRVGHTLVSVSLLNINTPLDEELVLAALARVVAAVP
jgi:hypothetical protein